MTILDKKVTVTLMFTLTISVLMLVEPCIAPVTVPTNPRPAPDIVSVKNNDTPTWIPPTYYTQPYTGETTESTPGHYAYNGSINITIRNRPIKPYTDKNGNTYNDGYYCIFVKTSSDIMWPESPMFVAAQSDSVYTIITLSYNRYDSGGCSVYIAGENRGYEISAEKEKTLDFRIQSLTGVYWYGGSIYPSTYEGEGSKYAEFTTTIPQRKGTNTLKPTMPYQNSTSVNSNFNTSITNFTLPNTIQSNFSIILITTCIIVIPIIIVAYINKQQKTNPFQTHPTNTIS